MTFETALKVATPVLGVMTLVATAVAIYVGTKFEVLRQNLATFQTANAELRQIVLDERQERIRDREDCEELIQQERDARTRDKMQCDKETAQLQGQITALTGALGDTIVKAVLTTLAAAREERLRASPSSDEAPTV